MLKDKIVRTGDILWCVDYDIASHSSKKGQTVIVPYPLEYYGIVVEAVENTIKILRPYGGIETRTYYIGTDSMEGTDIIKLSGSELRYSDFYIK